MVMSEIVNDVQRTFAALLEDRGLTLADIAAITGLSELSVVDQINGNAPSVRRIRKIENALGGTPLWTPLDRFQELNRASELLGSDVILTGFHELRRRAIAMPIPSARRLTSRDDLIAAVLSHAQRSDRPTSANEKDRN
jgi:transcriptional regulator with XRE-family HTH domain